MKRHVRVLLNVLVLVALSGLAAFAQAPNASQPKIDTGDTAWMLTSAALVLMMTVPGLALFYGGLVRTKNVLGTMMQSFILMAIVTVLWIVIGYSLAFADGTLSRRLQLVGLDGVGLTPNADYAATIPHQTFMVYQLMFAIITPALMTGAFAERMKFTTLLVFSSAVVPADLLPHGALVWGKGGCAAHDGSPASISPAAPWCTSVPEFRRWSRVL